MPLQLTGSISLADLATEFEDSPPYSMSEFYSKDDGIPASGIISMGTFYGKSNAFRAALATTTKELNLRSYLIGLGWNGTKRVEFTINSGVYVWSDNTSVAALNMGGSYPGGLKLINNGFIIGKGGNGGSGSMTSAGFTPSYTSVPTAGGPALSLTGPITIDNTNGYIGGGGGGGAAAWTVAMPTLFGSALLCPGGGGAGGGLAGVFTSDNLRYGPTTATSPTPPNPGGLGSAGSVYRNPVSDTYGVPTIGTSGGAGGSGGVSYYAEFGGSGGI